MKEAHTALQIQLFLERSIEKFQMSGKVVSVTTDNGANVTKAVKDALLEHVPCFAHTLNLAVGDVLKANAELADLRTRISKIVTFTRKSTTAKGIFLDCITSTGYAGRSRVLVQECVTRWNSCYLMFQRAYDMREVIAAFCERFSVSHSVGYVSNDEWSRIGFVINLLKPAYEFTVEMSSERKVTASKVIPMAKLLTRHYSSTLAEEAATVDSYNEPTFKLQLCRALAAAMQDRLGKLEDITPLAYASLLDPRYKRMGFSSTIAADRASANLKNVALSLARRKELDSPRARPTASSAGHTSSLWSKFATGQEAAAMRRDLVATCEAELISWYTEPLELDKSMDPIVWWQRNCHRFPILAELAVKYLVCQGTSVPSERLFSNCGKLLSDIRSRITDDNAEMMIFLHSALQDDGWKTITAEPGMVDELDNPEA